MKTSKNGLNLIKQFEGLKLTAYRCPAGVPTVGFGTTAGVRMGMTITESQAEAMLVADVTKFENAVLRNVKVRLTQNQFDALVSFTYNLGEGNLKSSTLLKLVNAGRMDLAVDQFSRWNRAGGRMLAGLTRRRAAEAALFASK